MKSFSAKLAMSVAGVALLTTAAYAQTPDGAAPSGQPAVVHHRTHVHAAYGRHVYHTGTASAHARREAAIANSAGIYNQAAPYGSSYGYGGAVGWGSEPQPLYDAAVTPGIDQFGVACIGGRGVGFYPNPIAFGESRNTIEATGNQFILDRGYRGCFAVGE